MVDIVALSDIIFQVDIEYPMDMHRVIVPFDTHCFVSAITRLDKHGATPEQTFVGFIPIAIGIYQPLERLSV